MPLSESQLDNCEADMAPSCRSISLPCLNSMSVGMLLMMYFLDEMGLASVSILTNLTFGKLFAAVANRGAIALHGPHHAAQKSTNTGRSVPSKKDAKLASLRATGSVAMRSR